jgi:DNA polymerase-3 subunit gamma/tau
MPYEVTATRRRPKTFDELAGQEFVAATLKNSLETGQIAHAYLFSGPRGCGKTSAARILARALRCEKGPAANPCGVCAQCLEHARGSSMDVIEIDGASNTGVNDVRQIKEEVLFPPTSGKYKVYIIDEVHMLSNSAFNALLKTIEEPPPNIVFIFATTEIQKVPMTIKSRCQQFNFRLIPVETIVRLLKDACKEMGIEAEDEALLWIARDATGSLRDAYTVFDQIVSFSDGHIRFSLIKEKKGIVGLDQLNAFAEACVANDFPGVLSHIEGTLAAGVAVETFIIDVAGYYHSLLLIKAGVSRESVLGYSADRFSAKVLQKLDAVRLAQAGELLFNLHRDIRYSLSPRFELETLAAKLCWLDRWVSPAELAEAVDKAREALKGGIVRPLAGEGLPPQAAPGTTTAPESSAETKRGDWQERPAGFLSEGFERYKAEKQASPPKPEEAGPRNPPEVNPGVQTVLKLFQGTIVTTTQDGAE